MTALQRFRPYFRPYRTTLAGCVFLALAGNLAKTAGPIVLQRALDGLDRSAANSRLLEYGAVIIAVAFFQGALMFVGEQLWTTVAYNIECDLRNDFYGHLQKQDPSFFQANRIGEMMALATNDLSTITLVVGHVLISLINTVAITLFIITAMVLLSWKLALLSLLPLLLVAFTAQFFIWRIRAGFEGIQSYFGEMCSRAEEVYTGVRTIRAYTQEKAEIERFRESNQRYRSLNLSLIKLSALFEPLLQLSIGLSFLAVLWYGGRLALTGQLSIGELVEFSLFVSYLVWSAYGLGTARGFVQRLLASLNRIHAVMSLKPAIADAPVTADVKSLAGGIEFRDLTFTYPTAEQPALTGINLHIPPGQTVALVGPIGAGKSTLMNLIPRLLDAPSSGQVLIDGHPVDRIPLAVLRPSIGYAPQEPFLFSDTIANNIRYGTKEATQEKINAAAMQAGLSVDIGEFPLGYDTFLAERGITLSGGQKQRIAIARALITDPRILLLDDALSSVDADTEARVLDRLKEFLAGRTCLISSHRISTIKFADFIVVLDRGRIVERGTHDDLLAQCGLYTNLYEKQLLEDELAAT